MTTQKIIKKFLDYFDRNYDDLKHLSTLKTILAVLSNFIKTERTDKGEAEMMEMQNFINAQGASKIMLQKLSMPDDSDNPFSNESSDKLILSVIDFCIDMLDVSQNRILIVTILTIAREPQCPEVILPVLQSESHGASLLQEAFQKVLKGDR